MPSLIIETAAPTHPQISIDHIHLATDQITFKWLGSVHSGDCSEPFAVSLAEHGDMTLNELAQAVSTHMLSLLTATQ